MTKTISKVGNSEAVIFDAALMDLARLKVGDEINVSLHAGGSIVLTPIRPTLDPKTARAGRTRESFTVVFYGLKNF